jgi:hypothetical protein
MSLIIGRCEGCENAIRRGERHSYDRMNGISLCEGCTPTYGDMLNMPESFYSADDEYHTIESAKAVVDAHLAAGGSLDDKVGLVEPDPVYGADNG